MDNEKIAKLIKKIREDNNLTQKELADKLNVTYQAVSKWENGKNLPDISILTEICNEFNIDMSNFLKGNYHKKKKNSVIIIITLIVLLLLCFVIYKIYNKPFSLKPIESACESFKVSGSIAYDNKNTSIIISNIENCTGDTKEYDTFKCSLFENNNNKKIRISSYYTDKDNNIEGYLNKLKLNIDNYKRECKKYKKGDLELELKLTEKSGNIVSYNVPLKIDSKCNS